MEKKVNQAIALIRSASKRHGLLEVAYSGGKDSDVILELVKMAGVPYVAIHKNTTIDPPGTLAYVRKILNGELTEEEINNKKFLKEYVRKF